MAGPDKFDPTMQLGTTKEVNGGPKDAPSGEGTDQTIAERFDGAATNANTISFIESRPLSTSEQGGPPPAVDQFNGSGGL